MGQGAVEGGHGLAPRATFGPVAPNREPEMVIDSLLARVPVITDTLGAAVARVARSNSAAATLRLKNRENRIMEFAC